MVRRILFVISLTIALAVTGCGTCASDVGETEGTDSLSHCTVLADTDSLCKETLPLEYPSFPGIPATSKKMDENQHCAVFVDVAKVSWKEDNILLGHEVVFGEKDVWVFDKQSKSADKVLTTHADAGYWRTKYSRETVMLHKDSIVDVGTVDILPFTHNPVRFLIQECMDRRNVYTYIVTVGKDSVACLPTSDQLIGISREESLIIMESYVYYNDGGRYGLIEAYDYDGRKVASMDANTRENPPKEECDF